jgi:hypothetical protein
LWQKQDSGKKKFYKIEPQESFQEGSKGEELEENRSKLFLSLSFQQKGFSPLSNIYGYSGAVLEV